MPENAKYVGRPTRFGNPFDWQDCVRPHASKAQARQRVADAYRGWLTGNVWQWSDQRIWILEHLEELRGFDLACWCPLDRACHADVLIELLNET